MELHCLQRWLSTQLNFSLLSTRPAGIPPKTILQQYKRHHLHAKQPQAQARGMASQSHLLLNLGELGSALGCTSDALGVLLGVRGDLGGCPCGDVTP